MMIPSRNLTIIKTAKTVLLAGIVLLALSQLYFAGSRTMDNLEKLNTWTRQAAEIYSLGLDNEVEVITSSGFAETVPYQPGAKSCFAREEGKACLLLISDPFAWLSPFDQVDVLQNPQQPNQLIIASVSGFWLPVVGNGLALLLLAGVWFWLTRYSHWGKDLTWRNGQWIATASSPQRIGFGSMDAEPITETAGSRKAVTFWLVLIGLMVATLIPSLQEADVTRDVATMVYLIAALGMLLLVLFTFAKTASRTVYQDQSGLVDSSVLGIKRIPWQAIATVKQVNLSEAAQRSYDRHHTFSEERPETLNIYQVVDQRGQTIIRLSEAMAPAHTFHALLSRLRRQQPPTTGNEPIEQQAPQVMADDFAEPLDADTDFEAQAMRMMGLSMAKRKSIFHRDHRSTLIGLAMMLAPFLLLTGYLAYKSVWFQLVAEHTEGKVVEIKQDGLPSLIVAYSTPQGASFTTNSDGSAAYDGFHVGDTLTVFYDAEDPENARLDLFLELWLGTLLMGGLTGIVLLAAILIGRGLTAPMPMSMK